jgi:hypothetical protein
LGLRSELRERKQQRGCKKPCEGSFRSQHNPRGFSLAVVRAKPRRVPGWRRDGFAHGNRFLILAATSQYGPSPASACERASECGESLPLFMY